MPQRYSLSNTNRLIETITTPNHEGNFCMSPVQNGNTAPLARTTGDFYVPTSRESNTIPSTHSIGEEMSRSDLVSDAASRAIDAATAGKSAIPQSVLAQEGNVVQNFSSILERINTPADINELAKDMGNRIDHLRSNVIVER